MLLSEKKRSYYPVQSLRLILPIAIISFPENAWLQRKWKMDGNGALHHLDTYSVIARKKRNEGAQRRNAATDEAICTAFVQIAQPALSVAEGSPPQPRSSQ